MKKSIFYYVLLTFISFQAYSQVHVEKKIDSLYFASDYFATNKIELCKILADSILQYADKNSDLTAKAVGLLCLSRYNDRLGDYATAIAHAFEAKQYLEQSKLQNKLLWIKIMTQIGLMHRLIGEPLQGVKYFKEILNTNSEDFTDDITFAKINMAICYFDIGDTISFKQYIYNVPDITPNPRNMNMVSGITIFKTRLSLSQQNYEEALQLAKSNTEWCIKFNNLFFAAPSYQIQANIFYQIGKIDSALYYGYKALNIGKTNNYSRHIFNASELLSKIFETQNKADSVIKYIKIQQKANEVLYGKDKISKLLSIENEQILKNQELKYLSDKIELNRKAYILISGLVLSAIIVSFLIFRNRQKMKHNLLLENKNVQLENTLAQLKSTQAQLIQSEKLASLGELAAGIAHEIQNPLNFVNNFSELSVDLVKDLKEEIEKPTQDKEYIGELFDDLSQNQEKINHHGKRASSIVKGMLEHSRASTGVKELTDINKLADEYLRLSYHGLRAKDKEFNADFKTEFDENLPKIEVIPQDIGRVLLNLINNAFYAVKPPLAPPKGGDYIPQVIVSTRYTPPLGGQGGLVTISVKDNGIGMSEATKAKIFQPFFTTKPTGQGTGLGLSLAYDIIRAHGGEIEVESKESEGTIFTIKLIKQ